ncbi:TonB family protein [Sphingomonas sp. QA11]|uniref:energy transducer TonB family protein n=1 Tax=Sphingomonas sp. QA11 TaxID=2950605 RepID=UPI00234B63B1|nr:energy transducer TonB [Sphingomonas sp. QA11]WCM25958.1 TonB family protein [Sphingomonas sp. QA11]
MTAVLASVAIHAAVLGVFLFFASREDVARSRTPDPAIATDIALLPAVEAHTPLAAPISPEPVPAKSGPMTMPLRAAAMPAPPSATTQPSADLDVLQAGASTATQPNRSTALDVAAGNDYRRRLLDHIALFRRKSAFDGGDRSGSAMVRFAVKRDGSVIAVTLVTGSGVSVLDSEAIATIWRAQPMPPIPGSLPDSLSVTLPIVFGIAPLG